MAKLFVDTTYNYIKHTTGIKNVRQIEITVGHDDEFQEFDVNIAVTHDKYGKTFTDFYTEAVYDNPDEAMKRAKTIQKNFKKAFPKTIIFEVEMEEC